MKCIFFPLYFLWLIGGIPASMAQNAGGWAYQDERKSYGSDDFIFAGQVYFPAYRKAKGHPFYKMSELQAGRIYQRDRTSPPVKLKYNLLTQQVIVWHEPNNAPPVQLALPTHLVDSFRIADDLFIHHLHAGTGLSEEGYVQEVYKGSFQVFQAVRKIFNGANASIEFTGVYESPKTRFWLQTPDGKWMSFSNFKKLLKFLSQDNRDLKKTVKRAYRQERKSTGTPDLAQLSRLLKTCDE